MPRVLIEISDSWLHRYETGITQCLDTLEGLVHQIDKRKPGTISETVQLLLEIQSQLEDLRRNVRSWRHMF